MLERIPFIDSHTGGEPTRLILEGGPDLGLGPLAQRAEIFQSQYDDFRSGVVEEPRGSDVFVGALLCSPTQKEHSAGVIFFNNVDILGMCGHGMIGLLASLHYLGRLQPGSHLVETPVGLVKATLSPKGNISFVNVPSYRYRKGVEVRVEGVGILKGDIAWGGNWFFLTPALEDLRLHLGGIEDLVALTSSIRDGLEREGIRGAAGAEIDHIELYSPSKGGQGARTFVLCPGGAWDRSPCGTGTSAKMACLAADGMLQPGEIWRQESVVGSVFEGSFEKGPRGTILPTISGTAHVMSEGHLLFSRDDPFRWGLSS